MVQMRAKAMKSWLKLHDFGRFKINQIKIMEKCIKYAPNAKT